MGDRPGTHNPSPETETADDGQAEIAKHIGLSRENRKLTAKVKELERKAALAEKEAKELRDAQAETDKARNVPIDPTSTGKGQAWQDGFKRARKSKRKEAIWEEWREIDAWKLKRDHDRRLLDEDKQALDDEKETQKKSRRVLLIQVLSMFALIQKKNISSNMHGEAAAVGDAASPLGDEGGMDFASETKHERTLDEELKLANISETEEEEYYIGSITPVLLPVGYVDTANTSSPNTCSPNLTQGVRQREKFRGYGAEVKTTLPNGPPEQIEMTPIELHDSNAICEANLRSDRPRFLALYPRLLAWMLCIVLMAVGIAMTITACLYLQQAKKERNLWLEANGLTRAYLLAKAPSGDID